MDIRGTVDRSVVLHRSVSFLPSLDRDGEKHPGRRLHASSGRFGKKIYDEKCASCHLETLKGGRNESPALKGDEFLSHWTGKPLRELYSRIISTMPLADPGSLTPKETLDVVAYMLQKNGFRPGKGALQSPNQLNKIQFKTAK